MEKRKKPDGNWIGRTLLGMAGVKTFESYDNRKVADKVTVKGLIISTCWTSDFGYETAVLDKNHAYPVERYKTKKEALKGHKRWIKKAETLEEIVCLGTPDGLVGDKKVKLVRILLEEIIK